MTYKALYREWRPQNFHELVGQEHISKSLQNAIKNQRIAHAYLYTGPRGTGKTSTAKIMAKAVNCLTPVTDGEPCNDCANCKSITEGRSLDVMEIDAASNRGIDEIRDLRERVNFVPSQGKYKVYIVDEVHMLTTEAFNALLKTLEEPPAHVIFILATTEPHKIPATILSRCQRYDFRKIAPRDTEGRLQEILDSYGIIAEDGVLPLIVKKAEGGLRDAISILDQCISLGEKEITKEIAYQVLGTVKGEALEAITKALAEQDAAALLVKVNELLQDGVEAGQIIKDLLEHLRNMMLLLVTGVNSQLVTSSKEEKEVLLEQAKRLGQKRLAEAIALLAKVDSESRWRQNMRIVLEMSLLSLFKTEETVPAGSITSVQVTQGDTKPTVAKVKTKKQSTAKQVVGKEGQEYQKAQKPAEETRRHLQQTDEETGARETVNDNSGEHHGNQTTVEVSVIKDKWDQVMEKVKDRKRTVHAFLTVAEPWQLTEKGLVLLFKSGYTFHKEKVSEPANKQLIEGIIENVLGVKLNVICAMEEEHSAAGDNETYDSIKLAQEVFGSDIVVIKD
ncbi:MAG: DNA polymerase III subunit gamma/tau [Peptococcia bacterium]